MATLNELAGKLQSFIIEQQIDPHNLRQLSVHRYNNLKLKIAQLSYPNLIVCIGISEATYNLQDITKVDGGLGQDEKYVRKWLGRSAIIKELTELYYELTDYISLEDEVQQQQQQQLMEDTDMEGAAGEAKVDIKLPRRKLPKDSPLQEFEYNPDEDNKAKKEYEESLHNPAIPKLQKYEEASGLETYNGPGILKTLQEAVAVFNLEDFINGHYKDAGKSKNKKSKYDPPDSDDE